MIGSLALAGIFPLAGFWSKDEILVDRGQERLHAFFMVVGLVGAFLTAAYMTRCIYLTFFGEYRGHGHPHESPSRSSPSPLDHPRRSSRSFAGLAQRRAASAIEKFKEWVEPTRRRSPSSCTPTSTSASASISFAHRGRRASAIAYVLLARPRGAARLKGLTERNALARAGYTFLVNKYYLDDLYEDVIVAGDQGPDRARRRTGSTRRDRRRS